MNREKLREIIFVNLGQASMCWSEWPTGVFQSAKAVELGEEIMKAIDEYVEEDKEPGWNNPLVDFLDWEERYYKESEWQRRKRIEVMKEAEKVEEPVRKFKLDDSFKKALEEAVVSDTPATSWMDIYREGYDKLLASGMMFEFHPTWTGEWDKDKYAFCHDRKYKKLSPQDTPDIDTILEIEETDEEAAYRKGYMDGYDEGLYDGQYK